MPLFNERPEIFKDKSQLDTDTLPSQFPAREQELNEYKNALYPVYKGEKPKNLFIYGEPGTGKTSMTKYIVQHLEEDAEADDNVIINSVYINCESLDNSYQLAREMTNSLREQQNGHNHQAIPAKGFSKADVFDFLFEAINNTEGTIIIIIDEIDSVNNIEEILYEIPRAHSTERIDSDTRLPGIIGLSNTVNYLSDVPAKVTDTLNETTIQFSTYNASDLNMILNTRAEDAFYADVLDDGVINTCAAMASKDTSSARRALDLIRTAGEIARNNNDKTVRIDHVHTAEEQLDTDHVRDILKAAAKQTKVALLTVLIEEGKQNTPARTSHLYSVYEELEFNSLSHDRFRQHLNTLENHGLLTGKTKNDNGRYSQYQLVRDIDTIIDVFPEKEVYIAELKLSATHARNNGILTQQEIDETGL